jgi:hypothetical protein
MEYRIEFLNRDSVGRTLIVEPWAEEFDLSPNSLVTIAVEAPKHGTPQIEFQDRYVVCYLWAGATAGIYIDDDLISGDSLKIPVPNI